MLASREETAGGWVGLKQSHWRLLPVLNVEKISEETLVKLGKVFDEFKGRDFRRLTKQYETKNRVDEARLNLELAFLKALGIDIEEKNLVALCEEMSWCFEKWLSR